MNSAKGEFNEDLKQALGEDVIHLENSWRVQLSQSPVLTPADMAQPTPRSSNSSLPHSVGSSDVSSPLLLLAGILLILLPITGLSTFFLLYRRRQQRNARVQQAQQSVSTAFTPYGYRPYQPYSHSIPQQQIQPSNPFASYGSGTVPPPFYNNAPQSYTNPAQYMQQQFPDASTQQRQDYTNQQPKQAPQE